MVYTNSGDQELGMVIKHHEWVEGTEIGDWISELGQDLKLGYLLVVASSSVFPSQLPSNYLKYIGTNYKPITFILYSWYKDFIDVQMANSCFTFILGIEPTTVAV